MKKEENLSDVISGTLSELSKLFSASGNLKLKHYYGTICDYIENMIKKISRKERIKCYGGKCIFRSVFCPVKSSWLNSNNEVDSKEFIISEVTLYFQDINKQWITKNISGKIDVNKFDLKDSETLKFLGTLRSGESIEQKIDAH